MNWIFIAENNRLFSKQNFYTDKAPTMNNKIVRKYEFI